MQRRSSSSRRSSGPISISRARRSSSAICSAPRRWRFMSSQPLALQGKHAVVTGGGRGIGAAIASALADQGAILTLMGRDQARLDIHASRLSQQTRVGTVPVDVADAASVAAAFERATSERGPVQILINNAGIAE